MIIEDYCQVNSHFFYSEKLNIDTFKNYNKVNLRNIDQKVLLNIIHNIVFGHSKDMRIHLNTNKGEFLFFTVTSEITKDQVIEYLKENSKENPTYYFRNVDYFSYGCFGYAENNKIERYLSFNSEAKDDENVVEWIGKPHKWEYATHTFFTKKKLEDFEMLFDSDIVCEMISFYLPFINEELNIKSFTVYSKNKEDIINVKNSLNNNYKKINKDTLNKLYVSLLCFNLKNILISANVYDDRIILHDLVLSVLKEKNEMLDSEVLSYNLISNIKYDKRKSEIEFHNSLIQLIEAIPNAEAKSLKTVISYLKKIKNNEKASCYIVITSINKNKFKIELLKRHNSNEKTIFIGYNFSKRNSNKIYRKLKNISI